jgi:hypothetical protein
LFGGGGFLGNNAFANNRAFLGNPFLNNGAFLGNSFFGGSPFFGGVVNTTAAMGPLGPPSVAAPNPAQSLPVAGLSASSRRAGGRGPVHPRTRNAQRLQAQEASVARQLRGMMRIESFLNGTVVRINQEGTVKVRARLPGGEIAVRNYAPQTVFFYNGSDVFNAFVAPDLVHERLEVIVPDRPSVAT